MCQRDYISVSIVAHVPIVVRVEMVRNESEDLRRDLVDWRDAVPPGPNQVEDLERVLLENIELDA